MTEKERLLEDLRRLPKGLRGHIDRVVVEARRLAAAHGADGERAAFAALVHDVARALPGGELVRLAEDFGLPVSPLERANPILLHGPVGAELLARRYGVSDGEVLDAARYHTTGRPGMGLLERVLFVADKVEPGKVRGPLMGRVRELAATDLDAAMVAFYIAQEEEHRRRGRTTHPLARAAAEALRESGGPPL